MTTKTASKKTRLTCLLSLLAVLFSGLCMTSCSKDEKEGFKSSQEAVKACRTTLRRLLARDKVNVRELSREFYDWSILQDSVYNYILNDTTVMSDIEDDIENGRKTSSRDAMNEGEILCEDFFNISDSIKEEFTRLAFSSRRSLRDVLYFKLWTGIHRESIQKEAMYADAVRFYGNLDNNPTYSSLEETLEAYHLLLSETEPFTKEGQMLEFIRREDQCFRSLMAFLKDAPQKDLMDITKRTAAFFDTLTRTVMDDSANEVSHRIHTYLMMRFCRRVIQNAETCRKDLANKVTLTEENRANYRWMLIQPFFAIDNMSMAVITQEQVQELEQMAEELPQLLLLLDNEDAKAGRKELDKLSAVLVEYLLGSYIRMAI